ncbi:MAG: lysophospholipid acyltransferase family protein [Acidobacteriota bacterium]
MKPKRPGAGSLLLYLAVRTTLAALALLPRRAGQALGRLLGRVYYRCSARHRRIAYVNLRRAFGDSLDDAGRARIARAAFAHIGMICVDAAYFPRLLRRPTAQIAVYEGEEHLKEAAAEGRGVLVFSGHFGHWELVALLQHRLGIPMSMVVRPLDNPWFDRLLVRIRCLGGNRLLPKRNAARGILRALRDGRAVAILIDQNVRGDAGVFVDFFGHPASTTPSLATFAFKSGAPIVPVFSYALPDGRLLIRYRPALRPVRRGSLQDDIVTVMRDCTRLVENEVRERPECWLWMHDRWRTRPRVNGASLPPPATRPPAGASTTSTISRLGAAAS